MSVGVPSAQKEYDRQRRVTRWAELNSFSNMVRLMPRRVTNLPTLFIATNIDP